MLKWKGSPHLEQIENSIQTVSSNLEDMANIVAKHKADIFSILKDNIAEETDDENILKHLQIALNNKKNEFEKNLWNSSKEIDLSKNDDIVDFWTNKINSKLPGKLLNDAAKNTEIKNLVKDALDKIQHLDEQNKSWTLFGWKTFDIRDIAKNTSLPGITQILNAKDITDLAANIDKFVKGVKTTKNTFHIQHSKLYTKPNDIQREVSIRIVLYLYCVNKIIEDGKMTDTLYKQFKDTIEGQLIKLEIPKIKWIYNVKKELENVDPEYETLKDINTKKWDIDLWVEKYWTTNIIKNQNLTTEFENWSANDIETYRLEAKTIKTNPAYVVSLENVSWDVLEFDVQKDDFSDVDLFIDIGWKKVKLGEIWINNKQGGLLEANFNLKLENLSSIQSQMTATEISATFPLDLDIPIKWIKNVKNPAKWKVALTKNIKIKLDVDSSSTPTPTPTLTYWSLDDKLDVNFSDMRQTMKDISDERTYNEDSREYVDALTNKDTKFGRMLVAMKQAMLWDFFRMRKYKKELKDMDSKKTWLNIRWNWANIAKVHGWQWVKSIMELDETSTHPIYTDISNLALSYYEGGSVMSDLEFEQKLKIIFSSHRWFVDGLESQWVSIEKSGSDILQSLKIQKTQNELTYQVTKAVTAALTGASGGVLNSSESDKLADDLKKLFENFTRTNNLVPLLFSHYNKLVSSADQLDLKDSYENISKKLVAHIGTLTMIAGQSMINRVNLNIRFLAKWRSVDHIESKKWENQSWWNPVAKLWNTMYGKWYRWRRFPTKVLATWWTAALWGVLFWPLWAIISGSIVAWSLAAGKKSAQTKRKKHSIEKEYIKDRDNKTNMLNQKDLIELKYLDNIWNYNEIKTEIEKILSKPQFSNKDRDDLVWLLSRIIAWLDYQKKTWHNAFSLKKRVNTSRPEVDELHRETNYNEAMSDLYKLKELSLKRLQLWDSTITTEDDIRNETQYDHYSAWYNGDFKKFLKLFKKERRKEMWKTWWRTAAIYWAIWWITLWLSHFLDWIWWGNVDHGDVDIGEVSDIATNITSTTSINDLWTSEIFYSLWKFESWSNFSQDIADQLSSMPIDTSVVKADYFAGVDGTPADASSFTVDMIEEKISSIENILDRGSFSQATTDSIRQATSSSNVNDLISFAENAWADVWNQNLFVLRNLENIEEFLKETNGKTDIDFQFNFDWWKSIIWQENYVSADRFSWVKLNAISENTPNIPNDPDYPSSWDGHWWAWQGLYTEDNTHKWQDNI